MGLTGEVGKIRQEIHVEFEKAIRREFLEFGYPTLKTMHSKIHALPDVSSFGQFYPIWDLNFQIDLKTQIQ